MIYIFNTKCGSLLIPVVLIKMTIYFHLFLVSCYPNFVFTISVSLICLCLLYSLVGSLNKIPISIAGILVFKVPLSVSNLFSILFGNSSKLLFHNSYFYRVGLFAGVFFARAKMS
ncbi:hypothetical protein Lalb_Chr15g0082801 [Lupinus albus]|uniref:Uncharacterized protein n=1 Tax=Lupinus albus TaxID=3870 RepID=A0A6A4PDC8_LUPAL|nr:hypothetical protein Lalb_Chr15g0082801 [Lupinus albus]